MFVYQTCVGALIGDDIVQVCKAATERLGTPVIPVDAPGFVGSKSLGNRLGGEALFDYVIGTREPDDVGPADVNILGEYNVSGELDQVRPLLGPARHPPAHLHHRRRPLSPTSPPPTPRGPTWWCAARRW